MNPLFDVGKMTRLSYVPRWSIVPMRRHQSVAEHSFRTTVIANRVAEEVSRLMAEGQSTYVPPNLGLIIIEALKHDVSEADTGDCPSTDKDPDNNLLRDAVLGMTLEEMIVKIGSELESAGWFLEWTNLNEGETRYTRIVQRLTDRIEIIAGAIVSSTGIDGNEFDSALEAIEVSCE